MKNYRVYMYQKGRIITKDVATNDVATDVWLNNDEFPNVIEVVRLP